MSHLFASASAWPVRIALAAAAFALLSAPVHAQQPKAAQPKAKGAPAPAAPAPAAPAAAAPAPQFTFSQWTKQCVKPPDANAKQICVTAKEAFLENGQLGVSAAVIEPEGEPRKLLRILVAPLGLQIPPGTRVMVDQGQPMSGPYSTCFMHGCVADYEVTADLIGRMKQGQNLIVQGVGGNNQVFTLSLPLGEFGKAIDGPPPDPKVVEEQRKKVQEEVERKVRELQARTAPAAAAPKQ